MKVNRALGQPEKLASSAIRDELGELPLPPENVFLWGRLPPRPRVAIVGSRRASRGGLQVARRVARELAAAGVCVVSGGASGVDRAAHEGALEGGGATLVVGPVWLDRAYPTENRALFQTIVDQHGGYLCVSDQSAQPLRPYFHRRNAALVCLSECLLIGESGPTSGALNAAAAARGLGRPRFVLPWMPDLPGTLGAECELLLRGAAPYFRKRQILNLLDTQAFQCPAWLASKAARLDAVREVAKQSEDGARRRRGAARAAGANGGREPLAEGSDQRRSAGRSEGDPRSQRDPQRLVLAALKAGAVSIDEVCRESGMSPAVAQHQVLLLTLEGRVGEVGGLLRLLGGASAD